MRNRQIAKLPLFTFEEIEQTMYCLEKQIETIDDNLANDLELNHEEIEQYLDVRSTMVSMQQKLQKVLPIDLCVALH